MNKTQEDELVGSIHDLTRRLNDATWTAQDLCGIRVAFENTASSDGRVMLQAKVIRVTPATTGHGLQGVDRQKDEAHP